MNEDVVQDLPGNNDNLRFFKDGVPSFLIKVVGTHCTADCFCLDIAVVADVGVLLEDQRDLVDDEKGDFSLSYV